MRYLLLIFVTACADLVVTGPISLQDIEEMIAKGRYITALEEIDKIREAKPYSAEAVTASLLKADIFFEQGEYAQSFSDYLLFYELNPRHKNADYALYKVVASLEKELPSGFDRDLSSCHDIFLMEHRIRREFPNSTYLKDAKAVVDKCEEKEQNKEVYIADFYYRTKKYRAALNRYLEIMNSRDNYPDRVKTNFINAAKILEDNESCRKVFQKDCQDV